MGEHTAPLCRIVFIIEQHLLFAVFGAGLLSSCYSSVLVGYRLAKRGPRFSSVKRPPPSPTGSCARRRFPLQTCEDMVAGGVKHVLSRHSLYLVSRLMNLWVLVIVFLLFLCDCCVLFLKDLLAISKCMRF